jgi:hypothetical protein
MKKIDDEKLLQMLSENITQKEIAKRLGCVPSYITKRKKQLLATEVVEPPTYATLTDQQKKFCLAKAEGKTNMQAVTDSYEVTSSESAKSMATVLMKSPSIQASIAEIMDYHGLTNGACIKQLKTLVYSKDGNVSLKSLDQVWRLRGAYQVEPIRIEIDHRQLVVNLDAAIEALREQQGLEPGEVIDIPVLEKPEPED